MTQSDGGAIARDPRASAGDRGRFPAGSVAAPPSTCASMIVTRNLPFEAGGKIIRDCSIASGIVDRLLRQSRGLLSSGRGYRLRGNLERRRDESDLAHDASQPPLPLGGPVPSGNLGRIRIGIKTQLPLTKCPGALPRHRRRCAEPAPRPHSYRCAIAFAPAVPSGRGRARGIGRRSVARAAWVAYHLGCCAGTRPPRTSDPRRPARRFPIDCGVGEPHRLCSRLCRDT